MKISETGKKHTHTKQDKNYFKKLIKRIETLHTSLKIRRV